MLIEGERIVGADASRARATRRRDRRARLHRPPGRRRRARPRRASTTASWTAASRPRPTRYEDASRAAAVGGTTTIIDFAMQVEGEGLLAPLERRLDDIRPSAVDVALHCWMLEANRAGSARGPRARRARRALAQGLPRLQPARRADAGRGPARGLEGRGGGRRDHAGALRELADHPPAARGRDGARRHGLRRVRGLAARRSPRPRPSAARSRWRRRAAPRPTACTSRRAAPSSTCAWRACTASQSTASAARTTCCWTSRATSASARATSS